MKMKTTDLVYTALGAVLIAVCSWVSIPLTVPFTLQTFAVFCVLELLGGKRGTLSIIVYILLAAIGAPVLSGFKGGIGALLGMTGGYVLGFVFIGAIYRFSGMFFGNALPARAGAMILGLAVCYAFGTAWFMTVYARQTGPIGVGQALLWCVIPFIIPDLLKMALAVLLSSRIRKMGVLKAES